MNERSGTSSPVAGSADIRRANASAIYELLSASGPLTRAQLAHASGLTIPTVTAIVNDLGVDGLVEQRLDAGPRGTGRPGLVTHALPEARSLAVVNHRRGRLQIMITDLRGAPIATRVAPPLRASAPWQAFADTVVRETLDLHATTRSGPLAALSLSLPGSIDPNRGTWTFQQRPRWRDIPLRAHLEKSLGVPVSAVNVVDAALIGELVRRPERLDPVMVVYVGKGVGSAAVIGGRLVRGVAGSAGEFGHCTIPGLTARCRCGRTGCLEAATSAAHLRSEVRRMTGHPAPQTLSGMQAMGLAGVDELLRSTADLLGLAASWQVNLINPALVLLGGGPFVDSPVFLADFERALLRHTFVTNRRHLRIEAAASDAAVAGAVRVARELLPEPLRPSRGVIS